MTMTDHTALSDSHQRERELVAHLERRRQLVERGIVEESGVSRLEIAVHLMRIARAAQHDGPRRTATQGL